MDLHKGSLVELPKKGKAMVITDIHGNLDDFVKLMDIWDNFKDGKNNHLILTGDFIHAMGREDDKSIEVMELVRSEFYNDPNFHVLLGNHEWSVIGKINIFKAGNDLNSNLRMLFQKRFGSSWENKFESYTDFFRKLPIAVKTGNKVFISHSGPAKDIKSINEIINITGSGYLNNPKLFGFLWNRFGDYDKKDIESFLKNIGCKAMIVGHTPVKGSKLIGKKQLIISSSFSEGKKAYVCLDLEKEIKNGKDILKMVRYID
jgi:Icc-related predicted phosphoesterase